jgi:hypothetical protein
MRNNADKSADKHAKCAVRKGLWISVFADTCGQRADKIGQARTPVKSMVSRECGHVRTRCGHNQGGFGTADGQDRSL